MPVSSEVINLFIKSQNVLLMFFVCKLEGLYLIIFYFNGLLMPIFHFVCKLLSKMRKQHIAAVSEVCSLWLLTWKYYLIHPLFIDVNIVFLWVFWPILRLPRCGETTHFILLSVILSVEKGFYNISGLFVIFQRPAHFPDTCPRFFIDGHNTQFNCIKGKWHHRRHLY